MDAMAKTLYSELRKIRMELLVSINDENASPLIRPIIKEELRDIESTLKKMEGGEFGICEVSGEMMPMELLQMVPTLKTLTDCSKIDGFYRKGLFQ